MALIQNRIATEDTMASLSIKNVSGDTLLRLRARAQRNHRSLQHELLAIVEAAASEVSEMTVDELALHVGGIGLSMSDDLTVWLRDLRDGH